MITCKNQTTNIFDVSSLNNLQEVLDSFPYYVILVDENHNIVMINNKVNISTGKTMMR
jgi:hypothetical protein